MSSPVDGLRDASGGSSEQETNPVCHNDDSLHKRATHENGIPIELEEELLKTPPYCIKTAVDKSDCNNRKMLNSVEQPTLKEEDADDVEGNGKSAVQSTDMMSLGPDFTITEINNHSSAIDKKTPIEVSIFKVDTTPTVNGNTTDAEDGLKTGHVNGMVVINNKNNSTNGSSDFTPSKPVVTPVEESEDTAEEPMDSESNQLKTKDIPVIKWGIMKKRQSTPPIRQKKYPVLAPKPFTDISSPQSPNSATIPAAAAAAPSTPNTHEVFLQFVGIPSQYIPTKTDKLPSDNKIKLQTITQQSASGVNTVQRPTALVNPLPAQKLVRDNSTAVSVLSKGTQADSIPESVFSANNIFGALVLNAPSLAVGEWKSKNSIDLSDSGIMLICIPR
ncbi:hypothetical protein O3M35_006712 [Rhynocoris fuscipes]|uniref:Uncharacterized protein n=1 Tax=Rhynocoris fuscipes TaxID=488301 RepID=A0AAW1DF92_9HEMI